MPGFAVLSYQAQQLDGFQEPLGAISSVGEYKVKQNSVDGDVYATVNGGAWNKIIDSGGLFVTVTLQAAYNGGPAIATSVGVPVALSSATGTVLTVTEAAAGITPALTVTHNGTVAGSGSVSVRVTGANAATGIEFSDGQSLALSNASEGRLRYNALTNAFQVSMNGVAYTDLDTAAGASLQIAYNAGNTITTAAATPVLVQNAVGISATNGLVRIVEKQTGTNSDLGILYERKLSPAAAAIFSGGGISLVSQPSSGTGNAFTENGVLLNISHAPVAGGTITDTTVGIAVAITPIAANTTVRGLTITMGANASGALAALITGAPISCRGSGSGSERYGAGTLASGINSLSIGLNANAVQDNSIAIGPGSSANSSSGAGAVAIGGSANASKVESVSIGINSTAGGDHSICLGSFTSATSANGLAIGTSALSQAANASAIGNSAHATAASATALGVSANASGSASNAFGVASAAAGDNSIAIGTAATITSNTHTSSIAIGTSAFTTASKQFIVGATADNITTGYFGGGVVSTTPVGFTLNATGGSGAGVAGATFSIAGGKSGDAATAGGAVNLQTTVAGAGQTLVTVLAVNNTGNVTITTGTNAAGLRITGGTAAGGLELASSATLGVSSANEGRLRYNSGTQAFEISTNGGAYQILGGATVAANGTTTQVSVTNAITPATTILAARATRVRGILKNTDPAVTIYWGYTNAVTTGTGFELKAGESAPFGTTTGIFGVSAGANVAVDALEEYN